MLVFLHSSEVIKLSNVCIGPLDVSITSALTRGENIFLNNLYLLSKLFCLVPISANNSVVEILEKLFATALIYFLKSSTLTSTLAVTL